MSFDDGASFTLPAEFLRVESPSAEVQGHGPGQKTIVAGRRHVGIMDLEPVGNYAVRIMFDDLHSTGMYSWRYLYHLGRNRDACGPRTSRRCSSRASAAIRRDSSGRPAGARSHVWLHHDRSKQGAGPRLAEAFSPERFGRNHPRELSRQPPAGLAGLVLEDHALGRELVADAIGLGEVPRTARRGAQSDQALHLGFVDGGPAGRL